MCRRLRLSSFTNGFVSSERFFPDRKSLCSSFTVIVHHFIVEDQNSLPHFLSSGYEILKCDFYPKQFGAHRGANGVLIFLYYHKLPIPVHPHFPKMSTQPKTSSIITPVATSLTKTGLPPPPPVAGNTKKTTILSRIQEQPVFSRPQDRPIDPVISNNDIFHLMKQMKQQMEEQTQTNKTIFKEI